MSLKAYVLINTMIGKTADVARSLKDMPEIRKLDIIMGPYDIIAEVETESHDTLSRIVMHRMQEIDAIKHTMTCTVVNMDDAV
jgi:DNA-binding Lrp family transcriptional regulator